MLLLIVVAGPVSVMAFGNIKLGQDWRTADRGSAGIAPLPETTPEALVLVYAARAFNWRGIFAVHTWIATKPENASNFDVHHLVGWRLYSGLPAVASQPDLPDRAWYGAVPELIGELRGEAAARAIPGIHAAVSSYPYPERYRVWPGPNSNTFVAHVLREVPELKVDLPPTAVGKDFLTNGSWIARAPSGTGLQLSIYGLLGLTAAAEEGLELNLFGAVFGVDPLGLAIKLPAVGRIGMLP